MVENRRMKLIDIAGQRFGRCVVLRKAKPRPGLSGGSDWHCLCDCGTEFVAISANLRKGDTRSCGCLAAEWSRHLGADKAFIEKRAATVTRHGHRRRGAKSVEYLTWLGMKRRCQSPKSKDYANWGGRGIHVCERWDTSFEAFLADMGPRPRSMQSIDRKDPDGHYEPSNCRWATAEQQGGENKRTNRSVTVDGVYFDSLAVAARHFGVGVTTAWMRIESGIEPEIAVSHRGKLPSRRSRESYLPHASR